MNKLVCLCADRTITVDWFLLKLKTLYCYPTDDCVNGINNEWFNPVAIVTGNTKVS